MIQRFGTVARLVTGQAPTGDSFQVALESIESATGCLSPDSVTEYELGTPFKKGDVLFGKLRPYLAKVWGADRRGFAIGDIHVYRPREGVHPGYLKYLVLNAEFIRKVNASSYGAKMPRADWMDVKNIEVWLPSAHSQPAIAAYLDRETSRIDAMIAAQGALVERLKERRRSEISNTIDSDATLPRVCMRRLITGISQGWSPQCEDTPVDDPTSEWSVLKVGCVNGGVFRAQENKTLPSELEPRPELTLQRGDLIMSRGNTRELVGSAAVVDRDYPTLMLSDLLYRVSLNSSRVDAHYVALALSTRMARDELEMASKGASHSMQKLSQDDVRSITIPLPSLFRQSVLVREVRESTARTDRLISAAEEVIILMAERREALITSAVTARLDPVADLECVKPPNE
jgi:type I restriction enzyme S subunit